MVYRYVYAVGIVIDNTNEDSSDYPLHVGYSSSVVGGTGGVTPVLKLHGCKANCFQRIGSHFEASKNAQQKEDRRPRSAPE